MVAVGEAREVDVFADGDARQDSVPGGGLGAVRVDVDDHQVGRTAGDADAELRVRAPPVSDPSLVECGGVKAMAPTPRRQAGALRRRM
ncbi:hypothetical protein GCM10010423_68050 [Streptomyces levis]|uniref:Uncharacterized protein n=1 Tax=Streptomyces levis TaxID=285566 RepID=A0ABN3P3B8_9ACTN